MLRLQSEVIAKVRHRDIHSVIEVTIPQVSVAQIAERQRSADIGQPLRFSGFHRLIGSLAPCPVGLNTLAVRVCQTEHFFNAQSASGRVLGIQALAA